MSIPISQFILSPISIVFSRFSPNDFTPYSPLTSQLCVTPQFSP